jgi:biotin carboxylase
MALIVSADGRRHRHGKTASRFSASFMPERGVMFARIAVVNRGEAARRLIHAVREINSEAVASETDMGAARGPLRTVALFTDAERHAPFVREADLAYCLGPVDGSFASVIGGAPAAAVVFARQVDACTAADQRVTVLEARLEKAALASELAEVRAAVRAEKLSALAAEFDAIHSIQRAVDVGSVDAVIRASDLRPAIAECIDTWMGNR